MSESAYKPAEVYEDELDQLAFSIRQELRSAGFAPAFDPPSDEMIRAHRTARAARRRRLRARRLLVTYLAPALVVMAIAVALRLLMPGL